MTASTLTKFKPNSTCPLGKSQAGFSDSFLELPVFGLCLPLFPLSSLFSFLFSLFLFPFSFPFALTTSSPFWKRKQSSQHVRIHPRASFRVSRAKRADEKIQMHGNTPRDITPCTSGFERETTVAVNGPGHCRQETAGSDI